jgi:hypothetical protein
MIYDIVCIHPVTITGNLHARFFPGTLASQKLSIFKSKEAHDDMLSRLKNSDVEEAGVSTVFRGLHDDLNASRQPLESTNDRLRHRLLLLPPKQLQDIC